MPDGLEVERMREQFLREKPGYCFSERASQQDFAHFRGLEPRFDSVFA